MTESGKIPDKLDFSSIGEVLFRFGTETAATLSAIRTGPHWTWSLLKEPLFHLILGNEMRKQQPSAASSTHAGEKGNRIASFLNALRLPIGLMVLGLRYRWRRPVVILSNQADRIMDDGAGRRLNPMFDPLIREHIAGRTTLMLENAPSGAGVAPSVAPSLYVGALEVWARGIALLIRGLGGEQRQSQQISALLVEWGERNGLDLHTDPAYLRALLCRFRAYSILYRWVWMCLRPSLILSSERGATGECAAALRCRIPVLDFQHGLMDRYFTDYMYPAWMKQDRIASAAPSALVLFGALQGDFLEKSGFWDRERLLAAGSYRVDTRRVHPREDARRVVLFANQWHVFQHASELMGSWLASGWFKKNDWHIWIKLHPLDPAPIRRYYEELALRYPEECSLYGSDSDIYSLIPQARVLLGYDSTVLVEGVCLGKPVLSIDPGVIEGGLHTYVPFTAGLRSIRLAKTLEAIQSKLLDLNDTGSPSYLSWMQDVEQEGPRIFTPGYLGNMKQILSDWIQIRA